MFEFPVKLVIDFVQSERRKTKMYSSKERQIDHIHFHMCDLKTYNNKNNQNCRQIGIEQLKPRRSHYELLYACTFSLSFSLCFFIFIRRQNEEKVETVMFTVHFGPHTSYLIRLNGVDVIYMFLSQLQNANHNNGRSKK